MNYKKLLITLYILIFAFNAFPEEFELVSPDNITKIKIKIGETISHAFFYKGNPVISDSPFSLEFVQSAPYEKDFIVENKTYHEINESWEPPFGKHAVIRKFFNG